MVPLAQFDKAVWKADETFTAKVDIANYSFETMADKTISWQLNDEAGNAYAEGTGENIKIALNKVEKAQRLELVVAIKDTPWRNRWSIWVYPEVKFLDKPSGKAERIVESGKLIVTGDVDEAMKALKKGKKVLLSPKTATIKGLEGKFLPVFWSPVHFPKQAGTMGLLCNPQHPALANFPTEMHSNWQWWNLVKRSRVMVLDSIAPVQPIVESVDNFVNNRRLAQVFEAKVGKGSLIFSSIDLLTDAHLPELRQMQYSLVQYMLSDAFKPAMQLSEQDVRSLILEKSVDQKTDANSIYN